MTENSKIPETSYVSLMKNFSFYKFINLETRYPGLRAKLLSNLFELNVKGRIYLAPLEGVNGYVSVHSDRVDRLKLILSKEVFILHCCLLF